ncbi:hypothetical protein HY469_01045 [Candidatus Roizmanbacteria bacterium]|nr:hypothetical protein [Candidatus Roizmanbacteria bacterium]
MKFSSSVSTATTFSKLLALVLFVLLPVLGFYGGREYQKSVDPLQGADPRTQIFQTQEECESFTDRKCLPTLCEKDLNHSSCATNNQTGWYATRRETTETQTDDLSNWEIYRNEEYGFETKYNPKSTPNETLGTGEVGQFSYLLTVKFGTNPLKFPNGYELRINKQRPLEEYRLELIGHVTDAIDSEEEISINDNNWTKLNYTIFLTTDYVLVTTAITNHNGYSYAVTSSSQDIDQILSTFKFLDEDETTVPTTTLSPQDLTKPENLCPNSGGTWLPEYNECENITQRQCSQLFGGTFNECASACRHDPNYPNVNCIEVCIPVCSF